MSATPTAIETRGLSKWFDVRDRSTGRRGGRRRVDAVMDVTLHIEPGEMVGFIGPNGAGKSTTIKMLTGVLAPSAGDLRVLGLVPLDDRRRLARRLGVVFGQRTQLWWDLPLLDSFTLLRHVYKLGAAEYRASLDSLTEVFALGPFLSTPVRSLSLGQRMRGEIAAALLHRPELLVLDEPTIGLDVVAKQAVRDALAAMNAERGTTMLLTTHDLHDVEHLCERVVIIDHGRVVEDGRLADVVARYGEDADLEAIVHELARRGPRI